MNISLIVVPYFEKASRYKFFENGGCFTSPAMFFPLLSRPFRDISRVSR